MSTRSRLQYSTANLLILTAGVATMCALATWVGGNWLKVSKSSGQSSDRAMVPLVVPSDNVVVDRKDDVTALKGSIALPSGGQLRLLATKHQLQSRMTGRRDPDFYQFSVSAEMIGSHTPARVVWSCGLEQSAKKPHIFDYSDPYGFVLQHGAPSKVAVAFFDDCDLLFAEIDLSEYRSKKNERRSIEVEPLAPFIQNRGHSASGELQFQVKRLELVHEGWKVHVALGEETFVLLRRCNNEWVEVNPTANGGRQMGRSPIR